VLIACDSGLAPPPPIEPGFCGTVSFAHGTWPSSDSLVHLWIFASQIDSLDSAKVVTGLFISPFTIFIYPGFDKTLSYYKDSISYTFNLPVGMYKYIGVIQQISPEFGIRFFRVVGFYKDPTNPTQPGSVEVNDFEQVKGIDIYVDFHNPPRQPF
jgi:hypothetical protein